jgi:carboxylesterase type B
MAWVYGGADELGSPATYDARRIAARGDLVVAISPAGHQQRSA